MTDFLLIFDDISEYSKKDIDVGKSPLDVYYVCSSIRETFCLSYSIRKNNNLFIYVEKKHILLKIEGKTLRYLGPDERSQALLLNKAISKHATITTKQMWIKSTPGISLRKINDVDDKLIELSKFKSIYLFPIEKLSYNINHKWLNLEDIKWSNESLFIIQLPTLIPPTFYSFLSSNEKNINYVRLSKIKTIENLILYINFKIENQ